MKRIFIALAMLFLFPAMIYAMPLPKYEDPYSGANKTVGNCTKSGDPIYTNSGSIDFVLPLLYPGGPMDLSFDFMYNRAIYNWWGGPGNYFPANSGGANYFWFTPFSAGTDWYDIHLLTGDRVSFRKDGDVYVLNEEEMDDYKENGSTIKYAAKATTGPDRFWVMDPVREQVLVYNLAKQSILYLLDRNGNKLSYTYLGDDRLDEITDGLGRKFGFTYSDVAGKTYLDTVSDLTDPANPRIVTFGYEAAAADMGDRPALRSITDAMGQVYTFRWSTVINGGNTYYDNLVKVEKPKGADYFDVENTWDYAEYKNAQGEGRYGIKVVSQKDPYNNETTFSYNNSPYYTEETTPEGGASKFYHNNAHVPPSQLEDQTGKSMQFTKDVHNRVTSVTDRMGDTTSVTYHETGKIASITNNKGNIITYHYTAQNQTFADPDTPANTVTFTFYNLTRVDYPDGTNAQFVYDAKGNITQKTDRNGQIRNYQYNDRGQVTQITNPAGGVTTFTYNADDATLASSTGSDTGVTTYEYDAYKRLTKIIHPDATFVEMAYNPNNQVTSVTDELGKIYAYAYDANGNMTSATDPNNKASQYAHDLMDRVNETTNRRGKKSQLAYDSMNRLQSSTDPNGNQTQYAYNSRGWMNKVTDPGGKLWTTVYDDEGLASSMTTPLNRTTNIGRDKLGFVASITDPLGNEASLVRDSLSRITQTTDPMNRQTSYGYDNRGLLTSVTLPVVGATQYTRNNLGLLSNITDLNNQAWAFAYTDMGRISSLTDPLNQQLQYAYDQRGRLNQITYPDAATQTRTLSASGNVTAKSWSDGLDLQFTYDDLNRLTASENITLTYNEVGQVTSTANPPASFGATYDNGGRVATVAYADGLFTVTYTYDARSLLTQVADDLTNTTIQFTHDDDGRLTGITRSNNKNTTFTLDAASRVTKIQHGTLGEMTYTYNAAGEVTKLDYTLPLDPADFLTKGTENFTFDAASQVSATDYGYDTRGRLTTLPDNALSWDGATRLTSTSDAAMTYNGLGDLSTRAESGQTTRYYYNYALGLQPIVAEKDETGGQWKKFYVLSPGGTLLYMIDAVDEKIYCYHFDKMGNTLFLTDAAGTITDKYAYTPYGKLLAHEGSNAQPFTFVGAWQIRQEGNGIYQMRARYYDAVTARFVSREPLWPRIAKPRSLNAYQYAKQNPMMYVDRTGFDANILDYLSEQKYQINTIGDVLDALAKEQQRFQKAFGNVRGLLEFKALFGDRKAIEKITKMGEIWFAESRKEVERERKEWEKEAQKLREEKELHIKNLTKKAYKLINLYQSTGDVKYLNQAKKIANQL